VQNSLVSILIPFKNTAVFLPECLDSIRHQTYTNWEVIAVNDNSKDASKSVVASYAKSDSRITLLENNGEGIIEALRTAYKNSRGKFITRMDSDDLMTTIKLETLVNALCRSGKGHVAIGQVRYFSHRGISNGYARYEAWLNQLTANGTNYIDIYKECVIPSPCWMTFRSDLEASGAFNSDRYPEDYDLTFRFYEHKLNCVPCNRVLHHWRDYDHRTSRTSEHYAQNYFLAIKMHYFLKLDFERSRPLVLWGAGSKGKNIAQILVKTDIPFHWVCDNPKKIGKKIYSVVLNHYSILKKLTAPQSIITVANADAQTLIKHYLADLGQKQQSDFFFFC